MHGFIKPSFHFSPILHVVNDFAIRHKYMLLKDFNDSLFYFHLYNLAILDVSNFLSLMLILFLKHFTVKRHEPWIWRYINLLLLLLLLYYSLARIMTFI